MTSDFWVGKGSSGGNTDLALSPLSKVGFYGKLGVKSKGQLVSECLFAVINFPNNQQKN